MTQDIKDVETENNLHPEIAKIHEKYGQSNLVDMVHQFLSEKDQAHQQMRADQGKMGKFFPSSVGSCKRMIGYQMKGYPGKPKDGRTSLILENGNSFHERMEDMFDEMGILIAPELKLKDETLKISGRSDAIIWNFLKTSGEDVEGDEIITLESPIYDDKGLETGTEVVYKGLASDVLIVELKSSKASGYEKYTPKTKPQKKHEMQLQLYFHLTGIPQGLVYYENKNDQSQKYYYVEKDDKMIEKIVSDIEFNVEHFNAGTLPEREFQPTSFECMYCSFSEICYPDMNPYDVNDII